MSPDIVREFRLGAVVTEIPGYEWLVGRLAIPNICASGHVVGLKFRDMTGQSDAKYIQRAGSHPRLFNTRALNDETDTIALTEGELDAITLVQLGIPAVSVPSGVKTWKKDRHPRLLEGYRRVVLFQDNDDAGRDMAKAVLETDLPAFVVDPPRQTKDVNAAHVAGYDEQIIALVNGDAK